MAKGVGSGNNPNSRKGNKNLKSTRMMTEEEQREFHRKGGLASAKARKANEEARKAAEMVLYDMLINDKALEALDLKGADLSSIMKTSPRSKKANSLNGMTGLMVALLLNGMNGNAEAAKTILKIAGVTGEETNETEDKATTGVIMMPLRGDEE